MVKEIDVNLLSDFGVVDDCNPFAKYIGYYLSDEIVGYIYYSVMYDRVEICNVFVREDMRNKRIGSSMMGYLIDLVSPDVYNITLEVSVLNMNAIALYKKYGFKGVAIRRGYYNGIDGILMELIL